MIRIEQGDARKLPWPDDFFHSIVTSPPYWGLRKYDAGPQEIGSEATPELYVHSLVEVGREVRRVLRDDGCFWLNIGDTYAGSWGNQSRKAERGTQRPVNGPMMQSNGPGIYPEQSNTASWVKDHPTLKHKDLCLMPARVALALQADGWFVRAELTWLKCNAMPSPITDRPTVAHETIYLLSKSPRYFFNLDAVRREQAAGTAERYEYGFKDRYGAGAVDGRGFRGPLGGKEGQKLNPAGRSLRTTDLFYDSIEILRQDLAWLAIEGGMLVSPEGDPIAFDVPTSPSSLQHFAMWPPRIVATMIKASTSERGCCPSPSCGAPWVRRVEREKADMAARYARGESSRHAAAGARASKGSDVGSFSGEARTVGWEQGCECPPAEPVPCRVLDPFGGAGTTASVAEALGREGYHVELNPAYLTLPDERRREVRAALLGESTGEKVSAAQTSLFDLVGNRGKR